MEPIRTLGHSTRSLQTLIDLLRAHRVARLVDVRTLPRSRRYPHFNREVLAERLCAEGIVYAHAPDLGGLRRPQPQSANTALRNAGFRAYADHMQSPEFERALDALLEQARQSPTAILCAEAVPWRCHRSLIADALVARGAPVEHILDERSAEPHRLRAEAQVAGGRVRYPGPPELFEPPAVARPGEPASGGRS